MFGFLWHHTYNGYGFLKMLDVLLILLENWVIPKHHKCFYAGDTSLMICKVFSTGLVCLVGLALLSSCLSYVNAKIVGVYF